MAAAGFRTKFLSARKKRAGPALASIEPTRLIRFAASLGAFYHARDRNQDHRTDKSDDQRSDDPATGPDAHHSKEPSAEEASENPEDDIHENAVAASSHHQSRKPTGDHADDNPFKKVHVGASFPSRNTVRLAPRLLCERIGAECQPMRVLSGARGSQSLIDALERLVRGLNLTSRLTRPAFWRQTRPPQRAA